MSTPAPQAAAASSARPAPLAGAALGVAAMALALGTFMQVLDTTIANVSLPTIAGSLGVSSDTGTWIITAFAVANGVTVPLTGWLMQRFGVVRTFTFSALAFTFASFLCGIAWSLSSLVFFRVIQGAVSGPMIPGSQALLLMIFPAEKRGTALGIWSAMTLAAPIFGPVMGGYISDNYHWKLDLPHQPAAGHRHRHHHLDAAGQARDAHAQAADRHRGVDTAHLLGVQPADLCWTWARIATGSTAS